MPFGSLNGRLLRGVTKKTYQAAALSSSLKSNHAQKQLPALEARLDFDAVEEKLEYYRKSCFDRSIEGVIDGLDEAIRLRREIRSLKTQYNSIQRDRKLLANKQIGGSSEASIAEGRALKQLSSTVTQQMTEIQDKLNVYALSLPNWVDLDAPRVDDKVSAQTVNNEGVLVATCKFPRRDFRDENFTPLDHVELAKRLDIVDFDSAVLTSGPRFVTLKNDGAMLELALAQWVMSKLQKNGFTTMLMPELVNRAVVEGCGFQPRGENSHVYSVSNDSEGHKDVELCLTGTSEIPLAGSMAASRLLASELPLRRAAFGHCFRAEAGGSGRGLFRLHQFSKAEMFVFCLPEHSNEELFELRRLKESICDELGLHWRTVDMFPHELGHPAYRKFDIQVFMNSQQDYKEVASISNCTDYQSRRLDIRYRKPKSENSPDERGFVHTLNGTAMAIPRIILSILETHQCEDGSVKLPDCIVPFMGGKQYLVPKM